MHSRHELLRPPSSFTQIQSIDQHLIFINDEFNTNILQYSTDEHRRLIQTCPPWETCPISNTRMYLTNHNSYKDEEFLLAKSIYFDVPIRDTATIVNPNNLKSVLLFQVQFPCQLNVMIHLLICLAE